MHIYNLGDGLKADDTSLQLKEWYQCTDSALFNLSTSNYLLRSDLIW